MYWYLENPTTLALMIIAAVITFGAQILVSTRYNKYKKIQNSKKMTGSEVAREILDKNDLKDIYVVKTKGVLSDHYDPKRKVIRLSEDIYEGDSIASIAVAAHEVGHAIQDKEGYAFMRIRAMLVPIVNIGSQLGYIALIIGLIFTFGNLAWWGIALLALTVVFQLVTLPVEFDASRRAKAQLDNFHYYNKNELNGVSGMLMAAAMTYVASLVTTLLELLRLVLIVAGRNDD